MSARELILAALLAALAAPGCAKTQAKPVETPPDEVLVSLPMSQEVTDYEEFIGHTDAMFSVDVRARVNGYLDSVNFNDGDEVEKDTVLFNIDPRQYQATFDNQKALVEQGYAHLNTATLNKNRADALLSRNAIGREEYDGLQGSFAEARASIGAAKAMLDSAQLNLDWTKVKAPISGRLSRRMVDPGNLVRADDTILTSIVSLDPMYVYFDIDERTMLKIRRLIAEGRVQSRQEAEVPVFVALSDETDFPHRGLINFSDNRVDVSTGTLRARGSIANPKPRLLSPGLYVRIRLPIGKAHDSVVVSEQAVGTDQGNKYVYVVKHKPVPDPKTKKERDAEVVEYRRIDVGSLNNGMRVVTKGLALDERVVVSGLQRVRPGKEVTTRLLADVERDRKESAAKFNAGLATNASASPAGAHGGSPAGPATPAPAATH